MHPQAEAAIPSLEGALGQDLSRVPVQSACPAAPSRCPFGGACHTCPLPVQARLEVSRPGDRFEQEADRAADALAAGRAMPELSPAGIRPRIQRFFTACLETNVEEFRRAPMCTPPSRIVGPEQHPNEVCGIFPGGSADCVVDEETGEITGEVRLEVEETNPCVRPCVELHEGLHAQQLRTLCPALRDCYTEADAGRRPVSDCWRMGFGGAEHECEPYQASVLCLEERLGSAPECADPANFDYAWDVLEGEKCYLDYYCRAAAAARARRRTGEQTPGMRPGTVRESRQGRE